MLLFGPAIQYNMKGILTDSTPWEYILIPEYVKAILRPLRNISSTPIIMAEHFILVSVPLLVPDALILSMFLM